MDVILLINQGKIKEAEVLLKEMKEDEKYYYARGVIYYLKGETGLALKDLLKAYRHGVKEAKKPLAYTLFKMGKYKEAVRYFLSSELTSAYDYFTLFVAYVMLNDPLRAGKSLLRAYHMDKELTKKLLIQFYNQRVKNSDLPKSEKLYILSLIKSIK